MLLFNMLRNIYGRFKIAKVRKASLYLERQPREASDAGLYPINKYSKFFSRIQQKI